MPTAPVAPTTATLTDANSPNGCSGRIVPSPESSKALCSARTASGTRSPGTTQEMRIGEVEIISMLIALSPSVVKTFAATPGCVFIPAPTIDTLPIDSSVATVMPSSAAIGVERGLRRVDVVARDGERHVRPLALGLGLVLDDHVDVHVRLGQRGRHAARDAGRVRARP